MQKTRIFCNFALSAYLISATFLFLASNRVFANSGAPQLSLHIEPVEFYVGESALFTVSVTNAKLDNPPELNELSKDFMIDTLNSSTRSRVRITNGSRVENRTIDYRFRITPKASGTFTINPPEVKVEGVPLEAESVTITVREQTNTDLVMIETVANPSSAIYPLVPFDVSVNIFIKACPDKYKEYDPLELIVHNLNAPQLNVPWIESKIFEDDVIAESLDDWLGNLSSKSYGFAVNNYRLSRSVFDFGFSMFDEPIRKSYFLPKPQKVERPDATGANAQYWKYSFTRKMRASAPSKLTFAPTTLKGTFLDFTDPENPTSRAVFLSTNHVEIQIKDIPKENAPENYIGVYGKTVQKATLSSQETSVGDAITLSLEYTGYGSFTSATAPEISELEGIKDVFRVYPASERSIDSGVAFDYKLRPLKKGVVSFPAIRTSFFNVETGQFDLMVSEPVSVNVKEGVLNEKEGGSLISSNMAEVADELKGALSEQEVILKRQKEFNRIIVGVLSAIVALATVVATFFGGRAALRANSQRIALSNRRILESARKRLDFGLEMLNAKPYEGFSQIRLAFLQLVAKRLPHTLDSYTDAEIQEFLESEFVNEVSGNPEFKETLIKLKEFFLLSEKHRFSGSSSLDAHVKANVTSLFDGWTKILLSRTRKLSHLARAPEEK